MSQLADLFGSKPVVPNLPQLSLTTEQQKTISGNQTVLPQAESLTSTANLFSQSQVNKMLEQLMPNLMSASGDISSNIGDELKGKIPSDVSAAVQEASAGKALSGGYGGTGAARDLVARDLGLTSLNLTQQGLNSAESWMQTANSLYSPSQINVSSMFVNPSQEASFDVQQQESQFNRNWLANQVSAQPDPQISGAFQMVSGMMGGGGGM